MPNLKTIRQFACLLAALVFVSTAIEELRAEELHVAIDRLIRDRAPDAKFAPRSTDSEFLRRIYLDLAGRIPTHDEAAAFLADQSEQKRTKLIDDLLAGPDYPRRMQELFDAMLMERRGDNEPWTEFLRFAFETNMPWDEMARAILRPDADNESTRGAAHFFTARLVSEGAMAAVDVPGLTRDTGRLLAGVDLGCAQCHDHISINDYKQVDFQGLHMIFENVQKRGGLPFPAVQEKIMVEPKEFMSVFTQVAQKTPPRVPGGGEISIATFAKGEEYEVPPDRQKKTPGVLKFSPLKELASQLTSAENHLFTRNIANRLWFVMMGRGLVEPLDLQHSANPPTHPELLDLLAREFASHKFDIKWFVRELALSECYQRTSVVRDGHEPNWKTYAVAHEKRLSVEQLYWSTLIAFRSIADRPYAEKKPTLSEPLADLKTKFIKTFANPPKEPEIDFTPTVKSALFLMHDEGVLALSKPADGNLIDVLSKQTDDEKIANEMFLSILSRSATLDEVQDVKAFLAGKQGDDRNAAIGVFAWALLASTEFCVNH